MPSAGAGQDSHYWTYQYGTRANLLGGLVIGSVVDISAVYYNPGALSLIDDPELILTSKVFELTDYTARGQEDRPLQLSDLRMDQAPGFLGGTMPFRFLDNHVLAYSVFTRHRQKLKLDGADVWQEDLIDGATGAEDAFAQLLLSRDLSETWVGLSWSAPVGRFGVGVSQFVAYRSQKSTSLAAGTAYNSSFPAATSSSAQAAYSYWNARLLWKLGVTWEWEGISWGLTATTPSLSVVGQGRVLANASSLEQGLDTVSGQDPVFAAAYREGLKARYQSPWSLGLGAAYGFGKSRLHLSGEYYGKNPEFTIMDGGEAIAQSSGDSVSLVLTDQQDDVLNAGLGYRYQFSERVTGYVSFRTDLSSVDRGDTDPSLAVPLNLYHITTGTALKIPIADITLGLGFSWGQSTQPVRIRRTLENDYIISQLPETIKTKYRAVRFIFAFSV